MGHVSIDIHKKNRALEEDYPFSTVQGVLKFYENIHYLIEKRLRGDIDIAIMLMDFEDAVKKSNLSHQQREVLRYRYELEFTQKETAVAMGLSVTTVNEHSRRAADKIAIALSGGTDIID